MNWLKWRKGRQNSLKEFYWKMLLFRFFRFMDCYLIKVKCGAIGYHTDKVENKKHYRLNIFLNSSDYEFYIDFKPVTKRIVWFRPDMQPHSFFTKSKVFILSIGFAI